MWSLRSKFLLATLLIYALATLAMLVAAHRLMTQALTDEIDRASSQGAALLSASLAPLVAARDLANAQDLVNLLVENHSFGYIRLADRSGRAIAQAGDVALINRSAGHQRRVDSTAERTSVAGHYHYVADVALDGRQLARVQFGLSAATSEQAQRALLTRLTLLGLTGLAAAALAQLLLSRVLTRGLEQLADGANRMAAGETSVQLPVAGDLDVARLTTAFNRMAATLAERFAALQEAEQRQRLVTEALTEGVAFTDAEGRVLSCNDAAVRILGMPRERLLRASATDAAWQAVTPDGTPFDFNNHPAALALREGRPVRNVVMGLDHVDGRRVWVAVNSQPLVHPGSDQPYAAVTSFADISAAVQAEQSLQQTNEALERRVAERTAELASARDLAERASQAKSEFLSRMSHELRTPLNAILGFAQVLRMRLGPADGAVDGQLRHIESAGWHLLELINDVLDLSRIESGDMAVSADAVELAPLVVDSVRMAGPVLQAHRVTLDNRVDAAAGCVVMADTTRLRQVLVNLITNAAKYNRPDGRVTLTLGGDEDHVDLHVTDTGVGMTEAQLASLYQPFNRLGADQRLIEGTGIGLVITRRLVELMGGSLKVQSVVGQGSTFSVRLERGSLAPPPPAPAPADSVDGVAGVTTHRLLYIEDNPSNRHLLAEVLRLRPRVALLTAADGIDGLAQARSILPDLMVVDVALPGLDGYALCRRLRALPAFRDTPIVALSANAMDSDKQRGRDAGFDHFFTKPLDVAQFLQWLDSVTAPAP